MYVTAHGDSLWFDEEMRHKRYGLAVINRVRDLRSSGQTFSEIKEQLKINPSKGTLSSWCKSVNLPEFFESKVADINKAQLKKG
jgi:hypothetical protein